MIELITAPEVWLAFAALVTMEIVLGIDNLLFISIASAKLPASQQDVARRVGIALALVLRLVLLSAIANAENNHQLDVDALYVKEAWVGKAMTLKRYRPRARGRMGKIFKHFSRLTIVLKQKDYSGDISPMEAARQAGDLAVVSQEEQAEIDAKAIDEAVGAENEAAADNAAEAKE